MGHKVSLWNTHSIQHVSEYLVRSSVFLFPVRSCEVCQRGEQQKRRGPFGLRLNTSDW